MSGGVDHKLAVLFVCLGNICRSPLAEGAFRAAALRGGLACVVDSAGTAAYHIGDPPDRRAIAVAGSFGVDISGQTARQITRDDFFRFNYIISMDRANLEGVRAHAPRNGTARLAMLLDAVDGCEGESVPDPYHGNATAFDAAWSVINRGVEAWVERLLHEGADLKR